MRWNVIMSCSDITPAAEVEYGTVHNVKLHRPPSLHLLSALLTSCVGFLNRIVNRDAGCPWSSGHLGMVLSPPGN